MKRDARIAGILYILLGVVILGGFVVTSIYFFNLLNDAAASQIMPRFIAFWLFLNGAAYVLVSALGVLSPSLESRVIDLMFHAQLAEIVVMLWLAFGRLPQDSQLATEPT